MWALSPFKFLLSSAHFDLPGPRQQGAAIWLSQTRGYYGAVDYKGLLIIIEHNPPTHLVATKPRHTRHTRRARASSPSGTRTRGRICCARGTSSLRPGTPTVFIVRVSGPHHLPARLCACAMNRLYKRRSPPAPAASASSLHHVPSVLSCPFRRLRVAGLRSP